MPVTNLDSFSAERLSDPEVIVNPYPYYDLLRERSPIFGYRDFPPGTVPGVDEPAQSWVVLNFDHVQAVARDHVSFSSRDSLQEGSSAPTLMLVNHDQPEHTRLRKIAAKVFLPSSINALSGDIVQIIHRSMDEFFSGAEDGVAVDIMQTYCAAVPARVMAHLLGMPPGMDGNVRKWATAFMLSANVPPEERQASNLEAMDYFAKHVAEQAAILTRGGEPAGPLLAAFLRTEFEGERLTVDEVIRFCMTVTVAGAETTSFYIGNMFHIFGEMPEIWDAYRADAGLFNAILTESLRYHGPPQRLFRVATRDIVVGGAQMRRGDWVACFFGAANYDPAVFHDPYKFILNRPNAKRHMSFGHGIHRCLGAPLANLEAEATAIALRDRYRRIIPAGHGEWQGVSLLNHGLNSYPIFVER